ncbi:MAG: hypothetical protein V3R93_05620 [Candidatus Hydrothermarchaeaceae archaeon]
MMAILLEEASTGFGCELFHVLTIVRRSRSQQRLLEKSYYNEARMSTRIDVKGIGKGKL